MEMRTNAGYTITDSVHIGKAEFVIGEMPNAPAPFVTGLIGTRRAGTGIPEPWAGAA